MGFRLVPKSVTLNDLERRNGRVVGVISPNSVAMRILARNSNCLSQLALVLALKKFFMSLALALRKMSWLWPWPHKVLDNKTGCCAILFVNVGLDA